MAIKYTKCWNCANATRPDKCPWVESFTPVPGWTATPTRLMTESPQPYDSYLITDCPLFERDAYRGGQKKSEKKEPKRHQTPQTLDLDYAVVWKKLDDDDIKLLCTYADHGMEVNQTAQSIYYDRRTVSSKLTAIRIKTGADPRDFWGLNFLMDTIFWGRGRELVKADA